LLLGWGFRPVLLWLLLWLLPPLPKLSPVPPLPSLQKPFLLRLLLPVLLPLLAS
jgi:hypothetical protein